MQFQSTDSQHDMDNTNEKDPSTQSDSMRKVTKPAVKLKKSSKKIDKKDDKIGSKVYKITKPWKKEPVKKLFKVTKVNAAAEATHHQIAVTNVDRTNDDIVENTLITNRGVTDQR